MVTTTSHSTITPCAGVAECRSVAVRIVDFRGNHIPVCGPCLWEFNHAVITGSAAQWIAGSLVNRSRS